MTSASSSFFLVLLARTTTTNPLSQKHLQQLSLRFSFVNSLHWNSLFDLYLEQPVFRRTSGGIWKLEESHCTFLWDKQVTGYIP
jgi:hypothetical protein